MSTSLTDAERGQIALAILKQIVTKDGINMRSKAVEEGIGEMHEVSGIPADKLREFGREMAQELLDKSFGKK